MSIRVDDEQHFTCRACGECCRRGFDILVTEGEKARYEKARASRWFRDNAELAEGTQTPFLQPVGEGFHRIRKRRDGVCGFLSPENRCRIHEELGADSKPLTCQLFPFAFGVSGEEAQATQSFCCPTIVRDEGLRVGDQVKTLTGLSRRWREDHAPASHKLEWVEGKALSEETLGEMRWALRRILDSHEPTFSLRRNVFRIGALVDDWTRHRVLKFDAERFSDYVKLTGEFVAGKPSEVKPHAPRLARGLFRGFLFASIVPFLHRLHGLKGGLALRARFIAHALHAHGLGPSLDGIDFSRAHRASVPIDDEPFFSPAYNVLRAAIENLGASSIPVADSLNLAVARLAAAESLYLARAGEKSGASPAWIRAITDAHDIAHVGPSSLFARTLKIFCPVPNAFFIFGSRGTLEGVPPSRIDAPAPGMA